MFDPSTCTTKLFADDLKLFAEITDHNSASNFQSNLDSLYAWSIRWQIGISNSKSSILDLGISQHQPFSIGSSFLTSPLFVKDLGIIIDPQLKFNSHIFEIVKRANQRAALIHRSFLSKNTQHLVLAFKIYVRQLLEYASPAWNPTQTGLIETIEKVQRTFTKRLPGLSNLSYEDRLKTFQMQTLEHRRLQNDQHTCFNIVHNNICLQPQTFFTFSPNTNTRGHQFRFIVPIAKTNTKKYFFHVELFTHGTVSRLI